MRRTKEDAEATRLSLIRAAGRIFSEQGFTAARLSEIAREADVTRGAIYWHFGNKRRLFAELIKEKVTPFFNLLDEVMAGDLGPLEKLRAVLLETATKIESDADFKTSQRLDFVITAMIERDELIKEYLDKEKTRIKNALRQVVEDGQARGEINDRFDADDIISHLIIFLHGISFMLVKKEEQLSINERIRELVDIEINAIRQNTDQ